MSEFILYFKSMIMIQAEEGLTWIERISYPEMKKDAQKKVFNDLKKTRESFFEKKLANYKDVVNSLVARMTNGR